MKTPIQDGGRPGSRLQPPPGFRVAVVGGCGGIGRAFVAAALDAGMVVAILDLPASLAAHPPPAACLVYAVDATSPTDVESAFAGIRAAWGALDGLVNLCGFPGPRTPLLELDPATWREVSQGNLDAAFLSSKYALPLLLQGSAPAMVHVASSLAVKASPGYGPYASAKAGILALTRMLAAEHSPAIRVNAVAPSAVRTEFITGGTGRKAQGSPPLLDLDAYGRTLPLQRVAEADDVVGPILFLLGPGSRYMTGQVLHVNGGLFQP
jgi:3-oxoacyl-[acyl-carrier protein] reductase